MTIRQLKPIVIKPESVQTPQCCVRVEEPVGSRGWRKERYMRLRPGLDPDLCQHSSVFEIDGYFYCRMHAGQKTLEMWREGRLVLADRQD